MDVREAVCNLPVLVSGEFHVLIRAYEPEYEPHRNSESPPRRIAVATILATRPNRVFTRDQLLDAVWGTERFVTPRSVDVYIRRLREKVESDADHPSFLKTVRGAGYMFESTLQAVRQE